MKVFARISLPYRLALPAAFEMLALVAIPLVLTLSRLVGLSVIPPAVANSSEPTGVRKSYGIQPGRWQMGLVIAILQTAQSLNVAVIHFVISAVVGWAFALRHSYPVASIVPVLLCRVLLCLMWGDGMVSSARLTISQQYFHGLLNGLRYTGFARSKLQS